MPSDDGATVTITDVALPEAYCVGGDTRGTPPNTWRHAGHLLFRNWLKVIADGRGARCEDTRTFLAGA